MPSYKEFPGEDGTPVFIELEVDETNLSPGEVEVGLVDMMQGGITKAKTTFEKSMETVVKKNAQALMNAVAHLPEKPSEVEFTFGLKACGEVGNIAIAKSQATANFCIKLVWKDKGEG